ncbi:hypothetical protein Acid7E03_05680 [Acidisoma sp. 7E03]
MARADTVIAPSNAFADALRVAYGPHASLSVIANGRSAAGAIPSDPRSTRIVTAGRLWDDAKNVVLLNQVAEMSGLDITAAGPLASPSGHRVMLPALSCIGSLKEGALRRFVAGSGIFASPALYEPFGLAVLEAAQASAALVLSDIPSFRELWEGCAIFLPARDPAPWSEVLALLQADPTRRRALGEAACRRAANYAPQTQAAATWALHQGFATRGHWTRAA